MSQDSYKQNVRKPVIDQLIELTNKYTLEPLKLLLKTDGNKITGAKFDGKVDILQFLEGIYENNSWENGLNYIFNKKLPHKYHIQYLFTKTIEKILETSLEIPKRASYLRTIVLELERLLSHLEMLALFAKTFSYPLLFSRISQTYNLCIEILNLIDKTNQDTSFITIGGISSNLDEGIGKEIILLLIKLEKQILKIRRKFVKSHIIKDAISDTGFISRETARKLSLSGPLARSAGITYDTRKSDPYAVYNEVVFTIPVSDTCDIFGEIVVRLDELAESTSIIKQLINDLPSGQIYDKPSEIITTNSSAVTRIESPNGELLAYTISKNGSLTSKPKLFKLTSPLQMNGQGLLARLSGEQIEKIPLILATIGNGWQ
jgi:NADH:ubiquinone oxidoreductase subunit D